MFPMTVKEKGGAAGALVKMEGVKSQDSVNFRKMSSE